MHRNFSFPLLHCYSAMYVLQMQMQHCNNYQNNQDLSLLSGSDILPIIDPAERVRYMTCRLTSRHPARCLLEGNLKKKSWCDSIALLLTLALHDRSCAFRLTWEQRPLSSLCAWETLKPSPGRRTRVRVEGLVKPWGRSTEVRFNLFRTKKSSAMPTKKSLPQE